MSITIKAGEHGYYVDLPGCVPNGFGEPVADADPDNRKKKVLYLECTIKGVTPFNKGTHVPLYVDDVNGVQHRLLHDPESRLCVIERPFNGGHEFVRSLELADDSNAWLFLVGKDVEA
jgi:hypothetical protein